MNIINIKHILSWFPMIIIAFANATLRELVFVKYFSELRAHQLSTISLILFCTVYVGIVFRFLNIQTGKQALLVGFVWTLLTIVFEFSLGRLTNKSWSQLLENYNLFAGYIWVLFLICIFILPFIFYKIKND